MAVLARRALALCMSLGMGALGACGSHDGASSDAGIDSTGAADAGEDSTGRSDAGDAAHPTDATQDTRAPDAANDASQTGGLLLRGTVVTPDTSFVGAVLVQGERITCVAAATGCDGMASAAGAHTVD